MPFKDLRAFLEKLEEKKETVHIKTEVDPKYEIAAIANKVNRQKGPALYFEKVKGHDVPLVCNLFGTTKRYSMAFETTYEELPNEWIKRGAKGPVAPKIVKTGPCKENKMFGDDINLLKFTIPIWNEKDAGRYITFGSVVTRDPDTGVQNAGMYRMMVHDKKTTGILLPPFRHAELHRQRYEARGEACPISIALGIDPSLGLSTVVPYPQDVDEYHMAGALRGGKPVELVKCETNDILVPASSEIVIEGEIPIGVTKWEGPFGEFTGYYGKPLDRLVINVKAITFRNKPIYHGLYMGIPVPPTEETIVRGLPIKLEILRTCPLPGIKKLSLTGMGAFNCVVSVKKEFDGFGKMMACSILGLWAGRSIKTIIVVDDDIDPENWDEVDWALAGRLFPDKDVEILKDYICVPLDPTLRARSREYGMSVCSKMIIDATRPIREDFPESTRPKPDVMKKVEAGWKKYGIELK